MKILYWAIIFDNFKGEDSAVYFKNYEIAKKNFEILCEKNKDQEEFKRSEDRAVWFDPCYNEYSTYITLEKDELPTVYNEIIF